MEPVRGLVMAAGLDWLEGLLPVLFVLIWIISQVMNLFRGAAKKPAVPPAVNPRQPMPPRGGEPGERLDGEIEEFLRRSFGRPAQPPPRAGATTAKPPRQRPRRSAAAPTPEVAAASIGQRAGDAGGDIAGHVASAFAHDLAHQSPDRVATQTHRATEPSVASDLHAALRSPGGLRRLILMQEVLERPTHRW